MEKQVVLKICSWSILVHHQFRNFMEDIFGVAILEVTEEEPSRFVKHLARRISSS